MERIGARKADHLEVVLNRDVQTVRGTGLDSVNFAHVALPELDVAEIISARNS